jgi:hypothetical protein
MLAKPTKRSCPSVKRVAFVKASRQADGAISGNTPSMIKTSAIAVGRLSHTRCTLPSWRPQRLAGAAGVADAAPPRMALKKSPLLGSTTITSLLFRKLSR